MVLVVSGKLDFAQIIELAQRYCGHWPRISAERNQPLPAIVQHPMKFIADPKLQRNYIMGFTPGPSAQDDRRFAAKVLADAVGDSDGSRFYWALVDNAIAEEADFGFYPHDGCGSFYFSLVTDPARSQKALEVAMKELEKVRGDLADDEVERARNKIASGIVLQGEIPLGRMRAIGGQWMYNRQYRSLEQDMSTLLATTPASLRDLMAQFPFTPMTTVALGPR
jgi:predicted Zn-dependent peptidase